MSRKDKLILMIVGSLPIAAYLVATHLELGLFFVTVGILLAFGSFKD